MKLRIQVADNPFGVLNTELNAPRLRAVLPPTGALITSRFASRPAVSKVRCRPWLR